MTPGQVAEELGLSPQRVRELATSGVLVPVAETGRTRLYTRENVEQVKAARSTGQAATERATKAGLSEGVAQELGAMEDRAARVRIRRANLQAIREKARKRLTSMQRELEALESRRTRLQDLRGPIAADLSAIDGELDAIEKHTEALRGTIERLAADLQAQSIGGRGHE